MSTTVHERLDSVERRLRALQDEVVEIRSLVAPPAVEPAPRPAAAPVSQPAPVPPARFSPPPPPRPTPAELLERYDLLGARGLALAGGAVTLLGVVFFYVLAANRGWIGPAERVSLGAIASALVFGGGLYARRRYGPLLAPFAAVGAGLAGWYTTLAAATILYDLLPAPVALGCAASIAAVGLVVALAWSSEVLAGLALLGAAVSPALLAVDEGVEPAGTAFAAVVFAALVAVTVRRRWGYLLAAGAAVVGAQALWTAVDAPDAGLAAAAVVGAVVALILAAATARQLAGEAELDGLAGLLVAAATTLALAGAGAIFSGHDQRGVALAIAAGGAAAFCTAALRRSPDLGWSLGGAVLVLGTVATAELVSGSSLAVVWAVQSAAATLIVARTGAVRFVPVALAYLGLALVHALGIDAPVAPDLYPELSAGPTAALPVGAAALAALALASLGFPPASARPARGLLGRVDAALESWRADWNLLRSASGVTGALLALLAAGLVLVELLPSFGHLATVVLLAGAGAAAVSVGARRGILPAAVGGFVALAAAFAKPGLWDWDRVGADWAAVELAVAAAAMLAGGYAARALSRSEARLGGLYGPAAFLALAGALAAIGELVPDDHAAGFAVLIPAAAFAGLAAAALRHPRLRDLSTTMWAHGLAALLIAEALVLQSRGIAVAYAVTAVALAGLAHLGREPRLMLAGWTLAGATTTATVLGYTPLDQLTRANDAPADSVWMLAACVGGLLALAALARGRERGLLAAGGAALGVYALSLCILELAVRLSSASLATDFQRGHTAVSGIWGAIGLCVLAVGLVRRRRPLRLGGLALLGVALAKLFLYDLSELSSVTRAFSFLAVGIALLAGGLLVQRLTDRTDGPPRVA